MNDILRDIPSQFESERLIIRALRPGDDVMVHDGVVDALQALRAWPASLPWAQFEPSVDAFETFARNSYAEYVQRKNLPMVMILKETGEYVGGTGFHAIDWTLAKLEVGYWCRPRFQKSGLTTEAVICISEYAIRILGAQRLTSLPDAQNLPSRRVAEKAGYVLEGIMRSDRRTPSGEFRDTCLYARVGETPLPG